MSDTNVSISYYIEQLHQSEDKDEFSLRFRNVFLAISNSLLSGEYITNDIKQVVNYDSLKAKDLFEMMHNLDVDLNDLKGYIRFLSDIVPFIEKFEELFKNRLEMKDVQIISYFNFERYREYSSELNLLYLSLWLTFVDWEFHFSETLKNNLFEIKQNLFKNDIHKENVTIEMK